MRIDRLRAALACMLVLAPLTSAQFALGDDAATATAEQDAKAAADHEHATRKVVKLVVGSAGNEDPVPDNPLGPTRRNHLGRLERIRDIAKDPEVDGVLLEVDGIPDMARVIDILDELYELQAAGKEIACYTEMLDRNAAMVASVADHLVVPPSGMIILEGMVAESILVRQAAARRAFHHCFDNFSRKPVREAFAGLFRSRG